MNKLIYLKDVSPEELRRWQLKILDILVYFKDFCEKHNLTFYLSYGTMLGAVRHNGFIPWDDDIDVSMPREDYDKLYDLWRNMPIKPDSLVAKPPKAIVSISQ